MIDPELQRDFARAESLLRAGRFAAARAGYIQLLQHLAQAHHPEELTLSASVARRLGEVAVLFGEFAMSIEWLELAHDTLIELGYVQTASLMKLNIASVLLASGEQRRATEVVRTVRGHPDQLPWRVESLSGWEASWKWEGKTPENTSFCFALYYLVAGQLIAFEGRYRSAIRLFRRGLEFGARGENAELQDKLRLAQASACLDQGDLTSAEVCLSNLGFDSHQRPGDAVHLLELLARKDILQGKLGRAKRALESAFDLTCQLGAHSPRATAALNLGELLAYLNQVSRARELASFAESLAQRAGCGATARRAQRLRFHCDERTRSFASGIPLTPSVIELWEEIAPKDTEPEFVPDEMPRVDEELGFLARFEERMSWISRMLSKGEFVRARAELQLAQCFFFGGTTPTDSILLRLRLHTLGCMLDYYESRYKDALDGLQTTVRAFSELGVKGDLWQALRFLEWTLLRVGANDEAKTVANQASVVLEELSLSLDDADAATFLLNKWSATERAIAREIHGLALMKQRLEARALGAVLLYPFRVWALWRRLAALLDRTDRLRVAPLTGAGKAKQPSTGVSRWWFARLMTQPRSQVTVASVVLPDRVLVVRIGWMSFAFGLSATTRLELTEWIAQCHRAISKMDLTAMHQALANLSGALQLGGLLAALPRRIRTLRFVPDGVLHGLPISALTYRSADGRQRHLGETYPVAVAFEWGRRARSHRKSRTGIVGAFAAAAGEWPRLPGATVEATSVTKALEARGLVVKPVRSRDALVGYITRARIVHLVCHGAFHPDDPSRSGLVLISPQRDIELFTSRDICGLDLRGVEQVGLSGCWVADSHVVASRSCVSIPLALNAAGVEAVLASLWPVHDGVAQHLFPAIYAAAGELSLTEALHRVRQACINGQFLTGGVVAKDPFFWAGLQVYVRA